MQNLKPKLHLKQRSIYFRCDKSGEFSKTAFKDTRSSDKEVPKPITISPTKKSETLIFFPIEIALDNKTSAPFITKIRPKHRIRN